MNGPKADMIVAHLDITNFRHFVIDYLYPIWNHNGGIYIKSKSLKEGFDFGVFWRPFEKWTWILLLISSFFISFCIIVTWKILYLNEKFIPNPFKVLLMTLQANLGYDSFDQSLTNKLETHKVIVFTSLLMGNVLWLTYNGALLSELIIPKLDKPFHDLESLIKTNYKYILTILKLLF